VGIIVIIPVVAVPGGKVVIQIPGELVFIDDAIAAGIAVSVGIHILIGIRVLVSVGILVGVGVLVSVGILVNRSRRSINRGGRTVDDRGRRYINAGSAKA
jgi:hypothetical protein